MPAPAEPGERLAPERAELVARLARVRERIAAAARRAGRRPEQVTLVGVSKRQPAEAVAALVAAGLSHCGESFVQEAREKIPRVSALLDAAPGPRWHLVGRLQRNKAKIAAQLFDVVESVDRPELALALEHAAATEGRRLDVLIQVNVSGETQKGGASPEALPALALEVARCPHLRLTGLMTVPRASEEAEAARPAFAMLRGLRDELRNRLPDLDLAQLSMGMSADFEVAVEEGATWVRVGTALFGARGGRP